MRTFESACALPPEPNGCGIAAAEATGPVVFWHRELPPVEAVVLGEHIVEATSDRVPQTFFRRDQLWPACYRDLMKQTTMRLRQEVARLGGRYAHVLEESIDARHDDATGEGWLAGRFKYSLLK